MRANRGCRSAAASSPSSTTAIARTSADRSRAATSSATSSPNKLAVFGRSYAAEPDELVEQLKEDTAIEAADTLLLTVPNQLGVDYNAHAIESILRYVAPGLGWR